MNRYSLLVILSKSVDCSKVKIALISSSLFAETTESKTIENDKSKITLFSQTFKVPENKVLLIFFIFGLQAEILIFFSFDQSKCVAEIPS